MSEQTKDFTEALLCDPKSILPYMVGPLLYSPATNEKIIDSVIKKQKDAIYSLALCLEDSISDSSVEAAEIQIIDTFKQIREAYEADPSLYLPLIFIRVRNPGQVCRLFEKLKENTEYLTGFIFPKYAPDCAALYNAAIKEINKNAKKTYYMMPILESPDIVDLSTRGSTLSSLKAYIDEMSDYVLNVRVGGNDLCKEFGIRRHYDETIYEILAVSHVLSDIVTVFSRDYVVSGPVWEYFNSEHGEWKMGLRNELKYDRLNGFIGKTVIHPKQISVVNDSLKISNKDYEDAVQILSWSESNNLLVSKNNSGERMNEVKTHLKWAEKTVILSSIYGIV